MARNIDLTKPLSEDDAAYVSQRPWLQAEIALMERNGELEYDLNPATPVVEEEDETEDEETYEDLTVAQLKEDLKSRDLSVEGNKATLIARLVEDDESSEEEDDEEEDE